jgi:hypothetical protein
MNRRGVIQEYLEDTKGKIRILPDSKALSTLRRQRRKGRRAIRKESHDAAEHRVVARFQSTDSISQ